MPALTIGQRFSSSCKSFREMAKKIISFILLFWGVFFAQNAVFAATDTGGFVTVNLDSSFLYPAVGDVVTITAEVNIEDTMCVINFGDGLEKILECRADDCHRDPNCVWTDTPDPNDPHDAGSCSYSFDHIYASSGKKLITFECIFSAMDQAGTGIIIEVGGTPEPCKPDGCNNHCPSNCDVSQDPDCGCLGGNSCCPDAICDFTTDSDCPPAPTCQTNGQCDQNCPPHCTLAEDPDCGCLGGNNCCPTGLGCNISNDSDCPPVPDQYDNPLSRDDIIGLLQQTIETIFGLLMGLAVLLIIIGGYVMGTSGGIPSRFDKGKKIVIWALIGFAVSGASRGIIALVEMIIGKQ